MAKLINTIKRFFVGGKPGDTASDSVQKKPTPRKAKPSKKPVNIAPGAAQLIEESEHRIPRKFIDTNAQKVVFGLKEAGYQGYLVGGCVRDLLLKMRPKDFDVTTDAHPEQAQTLFKRSRLIGRRFKLVHVRFGRDLIEVATFRAGHSSENSEQQSKQSASGMILRDNVYGNIEEDALRRDFTINAMYMDPSDYSILDFANGYQDLQAGVVRMIGNPVERYREDPVRMLRAVRFAAKLKFDIEPETAAPIRELAPLLLDIAPARLFDEVLKLLQSGHGVEAFQRLQDFQLLQFLLPQVAEAVASEDNYFAEQLTRNALRNTDRRLKQRKSVTPAFLFAVLLWVPLQQRMAKIQQKQRMPQAVALKEAANAILAEQVRRTAIPKRFSIAIREIWELQLRLPKRHGHRANQILEHPRFRAAYDLLLLREKSGEDLEGLAFWWTDYQEADSDTRQKMVDGLPNDRSKKPRKAKKPRSNSDSDHQRFDVVAQQAEPASADVAPEKVAAKPKKAEQTIEAPKQAAEPKLAEKPVAAAKPAALNEPKAPAPEAPPSAAGTEQQQPRPARRRSRAKNDPRNNR